MEKKKKILIADDDTHVHEMITVVLSPDEFEIMHAYDGQEAVEHVCHELPDIVVLDIMMPKKDGRDVCQELRADPRTKDVKILMLSAKDQQFDRIVGLEVGADDYETKPFSPVLLARKIKRMCAKE
ncbi:MAG: response regulator [Desulfobacterales bacterium]|nr:response regulator [Desulfobacterales bacterium]